MGYCGAATNLLCLRWSTDSQSAARWGSQRPVGVWEHPGCKAEGTAGTQGHWTGSLGLSSPQPPDPPYHYPSAAPSGGNNNINKSHIFTLTEVKRAVIVYSYVQAVSGNQYSIMLPHAVQPAVRKGIRSPQDNRHEERHPLLVTCRWTQPQKGRNFYHSYGWDKKRQAFQHGCASEMSVLSCLIIKCGRGLNLSALSCCGLVRLEATRWRCLISGFQDCLFGCFWERNSKSGCLS